MFDKESLKEYKQSKLYFNENKQSKNSEKEKSKKIIKTKKEKENINKKKCENSSYIGKKNEQLKDLFDTDIIKKEKFLVNKYSKLQKTAEKNSGSKTHKNRLEKKVYITILSQNSEKNEKF